MRPPIMKHIDDERARRIMEDPGWDNLTPVAWATRINDDTTKIIRTVIEWGDHEQTAAAIFDDLIQLATTVTTAIDAFDPDYLNDSP